LVVGSPTGALSDWLQPLWRRPLDGGWDGEAHGVRAPGDERRPGWPPSSPRRSSSGNERGGPRGVAEQAIRAPTRRQRHLHPGRPGRLAVRLVEASSRWSSDPSRGTRCARDPPGPRPPSGAGARRRPSPLGFRSRWWRRPVLRFERTTLLELVSDTHRSVWACSDRWEAAPPVDDQASDLVFPTSRPGRPSSS